MATTVGKAVNGGYRIELTHLAPADRTEGEPPRARIRFPYDRSVVRALKQLAPAQRAYHEATHTWTVFLHDRRMLAWLAMFTNQHPAFAVTPALTDPDVEAAVRAYEPVAKARAAVDDRSQARHFAVSRDDDALWLAFPYRPAWVLAMRELPRAHRAYDGTARAWRVPAIDAALAALIEAGTRHGFPATVLDALAEAHDGIAGQGPKPSPGGDTPATRQRLAEILAIPRLARATGLSEGETWTEGGCFALAVALHAHLGGEIVGLLDADDRDDPDAMAVFEHALLTLPDGRVIDGTGVHASAAAYLAQQPTPERGRLAIAPCDRAKAIVASEGKDPEPVRRALAAAAWCPDQESYQGGAVTAGGPAEAEATPDAVMEREAAPSPQGPKL